MWDIAQDNWPGLFYKPMAWEKHVHEGEKAAQI